MIGDREIRISIVFIIVVLFAIYRWKLRKLDLIAINTDHLVLSRYLFGELILYFDDIEEITVPYEGETILKYKQKNYTIDDIVDGDKLIEFCLKNEIKMKVEDSFGRKKNVKDIDLQGIK